MCTRVGGSRTGMSAETGKRLAAGMSAGWLVSYAHWLGWAYQLEFEGDPRAFSMVWLAGCCFFAANVAIICVLILNHTSDDIGHFDDNDSSDGSENGASHGKAAKLGKGTAGRAGAAIGRGRTKSPSRRGRKAGSGSGSSRRRR